MRVVIYGSREDGHAKVCRYLLRELHYECAGWLDDEAHDADVGGLPVLGGRDALGSIAARGILGVVLGFGDGRGRRALLEPVRSAGLALPPLVHPEASVDPSARVADGAVLLRGAVVGDDVLVGEAALINVGALLTHDVEIAAGASVGPGAVLAGRARVGEDAELGAGAVLLPDAVVGPRAVVGAGAVVTGSVAPGDTVVGVPARPLSH